MATIKVCGSYYSPDEPAVLYAQVLDDAGEPANTATVTLNLFKEDGTKLIDGVSMSYIPSSNGLYKYEFTAPSEVQRMVADVKSVAPVAYGTEDISVTDWTKDIATIESAPPPTPKARFSI